MKAVVAVVRDPFHPVLHRSVAVVRRRRSLRNLAPRTRHPVICQLNGQWISRKAWARRVQDGDTVVFYQCLQGGGGGSNPLKIILMVVVAIFAWYAAPFVAGAMGVTSAAGVAVVQTAIGIVGSMLVNTLIPAPKPTQAQQSSSLAAASPTYSLGAQGNSARIGQPIPVIYGRMQTFPGFAAMPYVEYAGNEQYLYQLFCIGQGEYEIEAIRVEDTPISSFAAADSFNPSVSHLKPLPSALPSDCFQLSQAEFRRLISCVRPLTAPANSSLSTRPKRGRKSAAITSPRSSILFNSAVDTPIALAARLNAPGRRSPSWPRSSSAATVPLPAICESASSAPCVSSADSPMREAAAATPSKTTRVSAAETPLSLVEAANLA